MIKDKVLTIPINVYEGEIEVASKKGLHPLHKLILQLIVSVNDLDEVVNSFGIKAQIVYEAIIDLLYQELLNIDLENSLIYPSHDVVTAIDRDRLDQLLGIEFPEKVKTKWVQDTATGQIFMYEEASGYMRKPFNLDTENQLKLSKVDYIKIKNLNPKSLIKVAKMHLRSEIFDADLFERINRITDLSFIDTRVLYIPLTKRKLSSNDPGTYFPDVNAIPPNIIERWMKGISNLDPYTINDLGPVSEEYLYQYDLLSLLSRFADINGTLATIFIPNLHKNVKKSYLRTIINKIDQEVLQKLQPLLYNLVSNTSKINIKFVKGNKILDHLKELIDKVNHQLIIGSGFISNKGIEKLLPIFEELREKKVKVLLIWGGLGVNIENLHQRYPIFKEDWIAIRKSETNFHSKFVVVDTKIAWITSCNLLSYWYENSSPQEMFCELTESKEIGGIIEYARSKINDNYDECSWFDELPETDFNIFSRRSSDKARKLIDLLREFKEKCESYLQNLSKNEILTELNITFEAIKKIRKDLTKLKTAILVENLEHRKLLRAFLANSQKSVKIGTDNIYERAIGPVIIKSLNDAIENSVNIEVVWGKDDPNTISNETLEAYQETITYLKDQTNNKINILDHPSHSHAKYLTMDYNLIIVTSYNLLAFSGNGLEDLDITDELGVIISGKNINKNLFK